MSVGNRWDSNDKKNNKVEVNEEMKLKRESSDTKSRVAERGLSTMVTTQWRKMEST